MKWWEKRPRWMKKMKGRRKKRKEEALMDSSSDGTVIMMSTTPDWWLQDMNAEKIRALEELIGDCKPPRKRRFVKKKVVKKGSDRPQTERRRVTFHASPSISSMVKREPPTSPGKVSSIMKRPKQKAKDEQASPFNSITPITIVALETFLEQVKVFIQICYRHVEHHLPEDIKDKKLMTKLMTALYSYYHQKLVPHLPTAVTEKIDSLLQNDDLTTALSDCLEKLQTFPYVCYQQLAPHIHNATKATAKMSPLIWIFNDPNLAVLNKVLAYLQSLLDNGYQHITPYLPLDRATNIYQKVIVPYLSILADFFQPLSTLWYSYYYQLQQLILQPYLPTAIITDIPTNLQCLFPSDTFPSHFFSSSLSPWGVIITPQKEKKSDSVVVISWCSSRTLQEWDMNSTNNKQAIPQKVPELEWCFEESPPSPPTTTQRSFVFLSLLSWNQDTKATTTTTRTIKSSSTQPDKQQEAKFSGLWGTLQTFILPFCLLMNHWMILFTTKVQDLILLAQQQQQKDKKVAPKEGTLNAFQKVMSTKVTMKQVQAELYNAFHNLSAAQVMTVVGFWIFVLVLWPSSF